MARTNLDMDLLRTLVSVREMGSLSLAGERLGRTQSAISLQIRRLEQQTGAALFRKEGRTLAFTEQGELLLSAAYRILALNDKALDDIDQAPLRGKVRIGTQQDFAQTWLPELLARYSSRHPDVLIEASVEGGRRTLARLRSGRLDLAVTLGLGDRMPGEVLGHLPLVWIARKDFSLPTSQPLPLVLFGPWCRFRKTALAVLDRAGIAWRIAFTSPSLPGLLAAVKAGLGVTVRTPEGLWPELAALDPSHRLPELGHVDVTLHEAEDRPSPEVQALKEMVSVSLSRLVTGLGEADPPSPARRRARLIATPRSGDPWLPPTWKYNQI